MAHQRVRPADSTPTVLEWKGLSLPSYHRESTAYTCTLRPHRVTLTMSSASWCNRERTREARSRRPGEIVAELEKLRILKEHELGVRLEHPPEGDPPYVVPIEE